MKYNPDDIDDAVKSIIKYSDKHKLTTGQFSPDLLPKYLREHMFQVTAWCLKHKIMNMGWHEMNYAFINYDSNEKRLSIIAKCDLCDNSTAIGIEV